MPDDLPGQQPPVFEAPRSRGLALSSLIVGIVSLVLAWWPVAIPIGGLLGGIAALVLGISARKRGQSRLISLAGIITGAVAILVFAFKVIIAVMIITAALNDSVLMQELQELEKTQ